MKRRGKRRAIPYMVKKFYQGLAKSQSLRLLNLRATQPLKT